MRLKQTIVLFLVLLTSVITLQELGLTDSIKSTLSEVRDWIKPGMRIGRIKNPLNDSSIVKLKIDENELRDLESYKNPMYPVKKYVDAKVTLGGKEYDCQIKLHGTDRVHRSGKQTSYRIKLSKSGAYYRGSRTFILMKSSESSISILAANRIAKKHGLISSNGYLVYLVENENNKGVYSLTEAIDKTYLEREFGITNYAQVVNTNDFPRKEGNLVHPTELDFYPGHIEADKGSNFRRALFEFSRLSDELALGNSENVLRLFNKDYLSRFFAIAMLFNDVHFMTGDNLKLIYNFDDGKFYPIFRIEHWGKEVPETFSIYDGYGNITIENFNHLLFSSSSQRYDECLTSGLFKSLLSSEQIRQKRDKFLFQIRNSRVSFYEQLINEFEVDRPIMFHLDNKGTFETFTEQQSLQLSLVSYMLEKSRQYANYTHVYGSYDKSLDVMRIQLDSYVPITIIDTARDMVIKSNFTGISLDSELNHEYNEIVLENLPQELEAEHLIFVNELTRDTVDSDRVHINRISAKGYAKRIRYNQESLLKQGVKHQILGGDTLIIKSGKYQIINNTIIDDYGVVKIEPGCEFRIRKNRSIRIEANHFEALGTSSMPIRFSSYSDTTVAFGNVSIIGFGDSSTVKLEYVNVENGSYSRWAGKATTGQFSVFTSSVSINNCSFKNSTGDDGLNVKYSKVKIDNCSFVENQADQVDLDFCVGTISNCTFTPSGKDSNGDGLDFSGSYALVYKNVFNDFDDKGISVGERSLVFIHENQFNNNSTAICTKDASNTFAWNNSFNNNYSDFDSYIKKPMYSQPSVYVENAFGLINKSESKLKLFSTDSVSTLKSEFERFKKDFHPTNTFDTKQNINAELIRILR